MDSEWVSWRLGTYLTMILLAAVVGGCASSERDRGHTTVADSAGVRVVSSGARRAPEIGWKISQEPSVVIGGEGGGETEVLYRVSSARVLADGAILISNSGTHELRVYESSGDLRHTFGREGAGPGEFAAFSAMRVLDRRGDTIFVADQGNRRIQAFDLTGRFLWVMSPAVIPGYGRSSIFGRFTKGGWSSLMPVVSGRFGGSPGDLIEMSYAFSVYDSTLESAQQIATAPARPRMVNSLGGGAIHYPFVPLTPEPVYAVAGDRLILSASGDPEVKVFGSDGRLQSVFRWSADRTSVDEIWDRYRQAFLEDVRSDRRPAYERFLADRRLPLPRQIPAVESILVDAMDHVWVARFRLPWISERVWHVLAPDGEWVGNISTPADVTVFEIGEDYLLGKHSDELGVERVVLYSLNR